jgi:hypothetical protein
VYLIKHDSMNIYIYMYMNGGKAPRFLNSTIEESERPVSRFGHFTPKQTVITVSF